MNQFDITETVDDTASENENKGTSSWSSAGDQYDRKMSAAATQGGSKPDNNFKSSARSENNIFTNLQTLLSLREKIEIELKVALVITINSISKAQEVLQGLL